VLVKERRDGLLRLGVGVGVSLVDALLADLVAFALLQCVSECCPFMIRVFI
jgi:hypothetical protein